jgi:hypothetical protein
MASVSNRGGLVFVAEHACDYARRACGKKLERERQTLCPGAKKAFGGIVHITCACKEARIIAEAAPPQTSAHLRQLNTST